MALPAGAEARFAECVTGALTAIEVDGWDEPIYFYPKYAMQIKQRAAYEKATRADTDAEVGLNILIFRARHKDGRKMFNDKDKDLLETKVLASDIEYIVGQMLKADREDAPGK